MKTFNISLNKLLLKVFLKTRGQLTTTYPTKKSPITTCLYCTPNNAVLDDHDRATASSIPLGEVLEKLADQQQQGAILKSIRGFSALEINRQLDKQKNIGRHFAGEWNPWIYRHPPPSKDNQCSVGKNNE
jgi:hypothetical protein